MAGVVECSYVLGFSKICLLGSDCIYHLGICRILWDFRKEKWEFFFFQTPRDNAFFSCFIYFV
jgi:hypothetical protein